MQKFNIVIGKKDREKLLAYLQERGDVEVVAIETKKEIEEEEHEIDFTLAELDFVLDLFKERGKKEEGGFVSGVAKFLAGPREMTVQSFEKLSHGFDYKKIIEKAKQLDNDLVKLETEERELGEKLEALEPWESLGLAREDLETQSTLSILGITEARDLSNLRKVVDGEVNIRKVKEIGSSYYIVITYLKKNQEKFLKALSSTDFNEVSLPVSGVPAAEIAKIKQRLQEIAKGKKQFIAKIQQMSRDQEKVQMVYDYLRNKKALRDVQNLAQDTVYMSLISAWAPRPVFRALKKILPQKFPGVYIEKIRKAKGERVPVVIRNQRYLEPFESVTRVYGMPEYKELDPTPYLSVFFAIFFGMCLSDAGYGVILLLLSALGVKFLKLSKDFKRLLKLMIYCSVTTIVVGVLYGAYFGIQLAELSSSPLRDFLLRAQVIDPIKSPLQIMIIALVFGFLQFWFAKVVNVKYLLSKGKVKDALLGDFIWILAIGALVFWGAVHFLAPSLEKIGLYSVIAGAGLLVVTQGHKKKNILLKFATGALSLYGVVGMISDILSYSRLLALGLTTSIIALVVNVIALLFRDMIPYAGVVVMVLVLIGGHLFNIGINILGGFIHSARLQYVEFFPKFLEGGGRSFKPLRKEYKFIRVKQQNKI